MTANIRTSAFSNVREIRMPYFSLQRTVTVGEGSIFMFQPGFNPVGFVSLLTKIWVKSSELTGS